jgi:ADP-dependent phosphofructokinase/glucokinase
MSFDPEIIERAHALCREYEAHRARLLELAEARLKNLTGDKDGAALHLELAKQESQRISPNVLQLFSHLALAEYEIEKIEVQQSLAVLNVSLDSIQRTLGGE